MPHKAANRIIFCQQLADPGSHTQLQRRVSMPISHALPAPAGTNFLPRNFRPEPSKPTVIPAGQPAGIRQLNAKGKSIHVRPAFQSTHPGMPCPHVERHQLEYLPVPGNDHVRRSLRRRVCQIKGRAPGISPSGVVHHYGVRSKKRRPVLATRHARDIRTN